MACRRCVRLVLAVLLILGLGRSPGAAGGRDGINAGDLRTWLDYIASDELEGRATYSAGLGLAAGFIQSHLRDWGVAPAGDNGTFIQTVRVLGVKATSRSSVTVRVGREARTFRDGEGVTFPKNSGGRRTLTIDRVEFAGYGLDVPAADHRDFTGKDVRGAVVVWLGPRGPRDVDAQVYRRLLSGRNRYATEQLSAAAIIGPRAQAGDGGTPQEESAEEASPRAGTPAPDFTVAQRLDNPVPPAVTASDELLRFLFSRAPTRYDDLKRRADNRDELPAFRLEDVSITFTIDTDYEVVRTRLTQNVVGIVEGRDPELKHTFVAFGAHYDHVGYAETEVNASSSRPAAPGRVSAGAAADRIWNGADDNGSGTVALMAIARAFAEGPRPRRSLLFVWHAGEERGLLGSRYFADHPTVPIDSITAQLNLDMIGRNREDRASEVNTVYLVGSDRISSELHEISREANQSLPEPMTLDYELNDPADLEQIYFRSDHYSYAAKGIPVIFFTTGLHADYHANTDHVDRIEFGKLTKIAQLVYETGARVANQDRAPARDNLGPRAGKGSSE
jgi:hypothetical protein